MRKTEEAVVRQDSEDGTKNPSEGGVGQKVEVDLHQNMVDEVNNWISESRESRRAEKAFSDERISVWKTNSSDKLP